jgi:dolichol-phosphate mannosyltransferase
MTVEPAKTLIFVPTYNERENAAELFHQILALQLNADLLFLDDNSPDGTGQLLDELAAKHPCLQVIHRSGKLGIGSAHLDGIQWAYDHGYTRLVTMDCDFTHSPTDIPRLLERAESCDVVVGSRWLQSGSLAGWNIFRRFLTSIGHVLTRLLLRMPYDATGAFRLYNLPRIPRHVFTRVGSQGYAFFFESLFLLLRNGFSVCEIPIVLPTRTYGHSKMSLHEAGGSAGRILKLYMATRLNPEQFCLPEPLTQLNSHLVDPQHWDEYWDKKKRATSVVYDVIAYIYRTLVIKRQLNKFVRKHFSRGAQLLHAGCGSGQVDGSIQKEMAITEVDISASALALCAKNNPRAHRIQQADIMNLPFADASFDGAYNLGVMEHFNEAEIRKVLGELRRVIKPGGKVVIFWPHARASSVFVLNSIHWILNVVLRQKVRLHPAEISLLKSKAAVEPLFRDLRFDLVEYYFGPSDIFVQAVLVLVKK